MWCAELYMMPAVQRAFSNAVLGVNACVKMHADATMPQHQQISLLLLHTMRSHMSTTSVAHQY
jgi:hypothetical protein